MSDLLARAFPATERTAPPRAVRPGGDWRDLIALAADFAFEADVEGTLIDALPGAALGWSAAELLGRPGADLLADPDDARADDPFRAAVPHRRRVRLRTADGGAAEVVLAAMPLHDDQGARVGCLGFGVAAPEAEASDASRGRALARLLRAAARQAPGPGRIAALLADLADALGARGAGIAYARGGDAAIPTAMAHEAGEGALGALPAIRRSMPVGAPPVRATGTDGVRVLIARCDVPGAGHGAIAAWRPTDAPEWDDGDGALLDAASAVARLALEHEAVHRIMQRQARSDPLTGLANRRAFDEDVERLAARADREGLPGTMLCIDLDGFKQVNAALGHDAGDGVLGAVAALLRRTFRPTDLVARLGGDEFAVWMGGVDHMTAAERAETLREAGPAAIADALGPDAPRVGLSIGIASRRAGSDEALDSQKRRADMAMYEVKRHGRGHWRVSLERGRS